MIGQVGLVAVADIEQVAEHADLVALLAFTEQSGSRDTEVLAEQIQKRGFDRGHDMDAGAQVKGLLTTHVVFLALQAIADFEQGVLVVSDRGTDDQRNDLLEGRGDFLSARDFTGAHGAGAVGEEDDVAGE